MMAGHHIHVCLHKYIHTCLHENMLFLWVISSPSANTTCTCTCVGYTWESMEHFGIIICSSAVHTCTLVSWRLTFVLLKWVCGMETRVLTPIPEFILLRYIAECNLGRHAIWKFERSPRTCLGPQAAFLAHWTCFIRIHQIGAWREIRGIST